MISAMRDFVYSYVKELQVRAAFNAVEELASAIVSISNIPYCVWKMRRVQQWLRIAKDMAGMEEINSALYELNYVIGPYLPAVLADSRILKHLNPLMRIEG